MSRLMIASVRMSDWLSALLPLGTTYIPRQDGRQVHWHRLEGPVAPAAGAELVGALRRIRVSEPAKSFYFNSRQAVASLPAGPVAAPSRRRILLGLKNCDVAALRVHDRILGQGEYADPFYTALRDSTVTVAADCPEPEESCFCNLPGLKPYVTEGVDVVLSPVGDAVLVETMSDKGEELVRAAPGLFAPATEDRLAERDRQRAAAASRLEQANPRPWGPDLPRAIGSRMNDAAFWREQASDCVECFACLLGCPTCYCFLLYDRAAGAGVERTRVWDACYEAAYTRVGGGANPRGDVLKRFANRFECKWKEFRNDHGFFACTGCGRCYRACMGKIDIRKVLGAVA